VTALHPTGQPPGRVVFFVQGQRVPAARARGFTVARALGDEGLSCEVRVPFPSVYGDTGWGWPWNRLRPLFRPWAAARRYRQLDDLRDGDVVFFQRPMVELPTAWFERRAARGRASVFDFDDAFFLDLGGRRKLRQIVAVVDQVIAGNAYLAEQAGAPDKTTVIPTVVDTDRFRALPTRDRRGAEVVVGWTGLRGNYPQLLSAYPGIAAALARTGARLLVISNAPPPPPLRAIAEYVPWREASELEDLARIDIGIMPLPDTPFTRGKCAFKLIQYMALGRPGVASPVGANREVVTDGGDGFLPEGDRAWEETLVRLIEDPALRARVGSAARARIESAYSLRAVVPRYREVLARLGLAGPASAQPRRALS
jgi:glycosyltransferase involved in cell wall biosynthesis